MHAESDTDDMGVATRAVPSLTQKDTVEDALCV